MNEIIANSTSSLTAVTTMGSWLPTVGVVLVATIIIGILLAAMSSAWMRRYLKLFGLAGRTIFYAIKGGLTVGAGYLLYWTIQFLGEMGSSIPPEWYAYGVIGFIGFASLGWIETRIWRRLKENAKKVSKK